MRENVLLTIPMHTADGSTMQPYSNLQPLIEGGSKCTQENL